ncbi:MAG: DUF624 domain-containing protein [Christensenellales bacterium]|jgi:uncharacterized membrane protein YesL
MANLMHNYYYGKAGKADYTPDQLPENRVQLFFEMLRIRFSGLVGLNLLYVLFSLPAIAWTSINVMMLNASYNSETGQFAFNFVQDGYLMIYLLLMVPCLGIAGIGATGLMYVLRNWARDQHSFVLSDFKDAIKGNWKQGLVIGLLNGLSLLLAFVSYIYYGQMASQSSVLFYIPQVFVVLLIAIWWMSNMIIYPMMVTYNFNLRQLIRNSMIMVVARLPFSVLFLLGSLAIPVICLIVPYGILIGSLFYLVIGFALTGFVYASYANSCFDKYLNPRIEGAQVGMGMRDPDAIREEEEEIASMEDPNPIER